MHEIFRSCNFNVPLPPPDKHKPEPPGFVNDSLYTAEIIDSFIRSVDEFYRVTVFCRRRFTLNGVEKYYPQYDKKLRKQTSFVHSSKNDNSLNKSDNFASSPRNTYYILETPENINFDNKRKSGLWSPNRNSSPPVSISNSNTVSLTFQISLHGL